MTNIVAATALKILMIGNSFSISNVHNMPQICDSMGFKLELGSLYIGGCTLERHWKNVEGAKEGFAPYSYRFYKDGKIVKSAPSKVNIPDALKAKKWDIVTIQQGSHQSWKPESYSPYGDNLIKTIRELCPTAEIVVQETWSYTPWDKRLKEWGIDQNEMYEKLHAAYAAFAAKHGLRVIPMGKAVQLWRKTLPVKYTADSIGGDVVGSLKFIPVEGKSGEFTTDGDPFHLNNRGQYLQSLVWTAYLFKADVTKCPFLREKTIGEENCRLLQKVACEACK